MGFPAVSVIIPTHNRPEKLGDLVADLRRQSLAADEYEIIVVDDGSNPPVSLADDKDGPVCSLLRFGGGERSAARNGGARIAKGRLLVFLDDDMRLGEDFLAAYLRAEEAWPDSILVGESLLPSEALSTPFGRFRQAMERVDPAVEVPVNFCAAGNMAISSRSFRRLNGFDRDIASGEDQDLSLRHAALGGRSVFVPEARTLHRDSSLEIRSYCRRVLWGGEHIIPFCQKNPAWRDNIERERKNGYFDWKTDRLSDGLRKLGKAVLCVKPITELLFGATTLLERLAPESRELGRAYSLLIGLHFFRGYRRGLKRFGRVIPSGGPPAPLPAERSGVA